MREAEKTIRRTCHQLLGAIKQEKQVLLRPAEASEQRLPRWRIALQESERTTQDLGGLAVCRAATAVRDFGGAAERFLEPG